jgi:hypothetical protein
MLSLLYLSLICLKVTTAWTGIIIDGTQGTQLYSPTTSPHTVSNPAFGLPHYGHSSAVNFFGRTLFLGGFSDTNTITNAVASFDAQTNSTKSDKSLTYARAYHCATVANLLKPRIIVCGGRSQRNGAVLSSCEELLPISASWRLIASLPVGIANGVMVFIIKLLCFIYLYLCYRSLSIIWRTYLVAKSHQERIVVGIRLM